jgi:hypothetical protein
VFPPRYFSFSTFHFFVLNQSSVCEVFSFFFVVLFVFLFYCVISSRLRPLLTFKLYPAILLRTDCIFSSFSDCWGLLKYVFFFFFRRNTSRSTITMSEVNAKAYPLADSKLTNTILDLVQQVRRQRWDFFSLALAYLFIYSAAIG